MNEIQRALEILGLQPGATLKEIRERYIVLAMLWHPDRLPDGGGKDGEEELREINQASNVLEDHFGSDHKETGCDCQAEVEEPNPIESAHDPEDPEEIARRRDEARHQLAAATNQLEPQATGPESSGAEQEPEDLESIKLRWRIAKAEAAAFLVICTVGWAGHAIKVWHETDVRAAKMQKADPAADPFIDRGRHTDPWEPSGSPAAPDLRVLTNDAARPTDKSQDEAPPHKRRPETPVWQQDLQTGLKGLSP